MAIIHRVIHLGTTAPNLGQVVLMGLYAGASVPVFSRADAALFVPFEDTRLFIEFADPRTYQERKPDQEPI